MIILLSPAKTMRESNKVSARTQPRFLQTQQALLTALRDKSVSELQRFYACSLVIAKENYQRLQNFEEKHTAIDAYTGPQYIALDAASLNEDALMYLQKNVRIISGMYGLLRPLDTIGLYRLPMALSINNISLSDRWKPEITTHLASKIIINLASKEYAQIIDEHPNKVDIHFIKMVNDKPTKHAVEVKKMRGLFVRTMALENIQTIASIKAVKLEGYCYQSELSTSKTLVFVKA